MRGDYAQHYPRQLLLSSTEFLTVETAGVRKQPGRPPLLGSSLDEHPFPGTRSASAAAAAAAAAADRAEERLANIDVGGFAYWKNIESFIHAAIAPQLSFSGTAAFTGGRVEVG
jgi:hypothetical protein